MSNVKRTYQFPLTTSLLSGLFCLLSYAVEAQQCNRVGWVAAIQDCGILTVDLDSKTKVLLQAGTQGLEVGKTFSFAATQLALPPNCPGAEAPIMALSCYSDTLPLHAAFSIKASAFDARRFTFSAGIYDEKTQSCAWTFSDGATASGKEVEHSFPHEGSFSVQLKVTDIWGGGKSTTQLVEVHNNEAAFCGYEMLLSAVGANIQGQLLNQSAHVGADLESIKWYFHKSAQVVSSNPTLKLKAPGYGAYVVTAEYSTKDFQTGEICNARRSQVVNIQESNCYAPLGNGQNATICPPVDAPVCGCDGSTYKNECEASAKGLSSWWIGDCNSAASCVADFSLSNIVPNGLNGGYIAVFKNNSHGDFNAIQLDFGDGSPLWNAVNWDSVEHHYANPGVYRVNITAWKSNQCISSYVKIISTDLVSHTQTTQIEPTDYVMPGDANGDRVANAYDLLNVGVGYYKSGVPRPQASTDWAPQFAPNWPEKVDNRVNFKHLDCDGNGSINVFDTDPIEQYYVPLDSTPLNYKPGLPTLWVKHNLPDTIVLDPFNPASLEFDADIMLGTPEVPALGIYGLAFAINYPEYIKHNPQVDYDDNSFLGANNHILSLARDIHSQHQIDVGLVRTTGTPTGGYGRIASLKMRADFIIIVDIIERSANLHQPLVLPMQAVQAIDQNGAPLSLSVPFDLDTVIVTITTPAVSTKDNDPGSQILVYPNPANGATSLWSKDVQVSRVKAFDLLGREVFDQKLPESQRLHTLDLSGWKPGLYQLSLYTDKGVAEKKLMVR